MTNSCSATWVGVNWPCQASLPSSFSRARRQLLSPFSRQHTAAASWSWPSAKILLVTTTGWPMTALAAKRPSSTTGKVDSMAMRGICRASSSRGWIVALGWASLIERAPEAHGFGCPSRLWMRHRAVREATGTVFVGSLFRAKGPWKVQPPAPVGMPFRRSVSRLAEPLGTLLEMRHDRGRANRRQAVHRRRLTGTRASAAPQFRMLAATAQAALHQENDHDPCTPRCASTGSDRARSTR